METAPALSATCMQKPSRKILKKRLNNFNNASNKRDFKLLWVIWLCRRVKSSCKWGIRWSFSHSLLHAQQRSKGEHDSDPHDTRRCSRARTAEQNLQKASPVLHGQEALLRNHAAQRSELIPLSRNRGLFWYTGAVRVSGSASNVRKGLLLATLRRFYTGAERRAAPKPAGFCYWPQRNSTPFEPLKRLSVMWTVSTSCVRE